MSDEPPVWSETHHKNLVEFSAFLHRLYQPGDYNLRAIEAVDAAIAEIPRLQGNLTELLAHSDALALELMQCLAEKAARIHLPFKMDS